MLNTRRLLVVGLIIFVLTSALFLAGRNVIRDTVVIPISYLTWVIGILISMTPQLFCWILVIIIGLVIAYRSFMSHNKTREREAKVPDIGSPPGRVTYWAARVNLMRMGPYYQVTFNDAVGRLALDLLAYRNRLSNRLIEKGLNNGSLHVPPDVRSFLIENILKREYTRQPLLVYFYRTVRLFFMSRARLSALRREDLTDQVQNVIQYMEEELEVHYGNTGE